MPLDGIKQPEIITLSDDFRLRKYDGRFEIFLPGYQDPVVYQNSEGIFDEEKKPNLAYLRGMCNFLDSVGELYYIEAREKDGFVPIGDVTVKQENPPIAIWRGEYRGCGVGTLVMRAVIERMRALGYDRIVGSEVYRWNVASQKLHEKLGFRRVGETERDYIYELEL